MKKKSTKKRVWRGILFASGILMISLLLPFGLIFAMFQGTISHWSKSMAQEVEESSREDFIPSNISYIYDKDGQEIAKLSMSEKSIYLKYDDIPIDTVHAFIAVEDRTFWENRGYDTKGIVRAAVNAVRTKGETLNGASTITQQLARKIFLSSEISMERKIKEIMVSTRLTKKYSKEEIMEFYVNNCCFANNIYGIEAAAQIYFGLEAKNLSLSQTAYLCAIPNRPSYYDPYKDETRALDRRDKILSDMRACGFISKKEEKKAKKEKIVIQMPMAGEARVNNYQTTFALDCAVRFLMGQQGFTFCYDFETMEAYKEYQERYHETYGQIKEEIYAKGYKIYTTLDSQLQGTLQSVVDNSLNMDVSIGSSGMYDFQGALTAVDNTDGKVIAIVGGRSQEGFLESYTLNRAYQSYRQPGSSIKPLAVYLPALMRGYTAESSLKNIDVSVAKKSKEVSALGGSFMSLRQAVEQSKNGCAYWLANEIGMEYGLSFLKEMQFDHIVPEDETLSSSLGGLTYGVTTVQMAGAYAAIANEGVYREPTCLTGILNMDGEDIYQDGGERTVYEKEASAQMVDILKGVFLRGTAASMKWASVSDEEAAGKTGTTNGSKDGWFCGITPGFTVAVWVGCDTPKELSSLYGATYPAAIWKESMLAILDQYGSSEKEFEMPEVEADLSSEEFLPGRSDSEVLSPGYTVADYRADRMIGKKIQDVIAQIQALDRASADYETKKEELYQKGKELIGQIYSRKYTAEMQGALDGARE